MLIWVLCFSLLEKKKSLKKNKTFHSNIKETHLRKKWNWVIHINNNYRLVGSLTSTSWHPFNRHLGPHVDGTNSYYKWIQSPELVIASTYFKTKLVDSVINKTSIIWWCFSFFTRIILITNVCYTQSSFSRSLVLRF